MIKTRTFYKCPVCGKNSTDRGQIQRHFAQHTIIAEEIVYCSICGEGWYVDYWGKDGARRKAAACYEKHKEAGNMDETAARAFFLSGGDFGYPTVKKGGKDGENEDRLGRQHMESGHGMLS